MVARAMVSSALVAALLAFPGRAQLDEAEALLARAEEQLEQKDKEHAAHTLEQVFWALKEAPDGKARAQREKRRLRKRMTTLFGRADTKGMTRVRLASQTADTLYKTATMYREKGWIETAVQVFEQVEALQPGRARTELMELRSQLEPADPNAFLFAHLAGAEQPYGEGSWTRAEGWIESPAYPEGQRHQSRAVIGWPTVVGDADLRAEIGTPDGAGKAAFLFGCDDAGSEFYMVELVHLAVGTTAHLRHWKDQEFTTLGSAEGMLADARDAGFAPIDVQIRGGEVRVMVGDLPVIRTDVDEPVQGKVGFFVSKDTANPGPVKFRHLAIAEQ